MFLVSFIQPYRVYFTEDLPIAMSPEIMKIFKIFKIHILIKLNVLVKK